jgi:hypothetical protein
MNDQETESGAIREIEPEVRTLFTKLVERDPQEAAKMLEPYPDEFVVQMLELLNPASALKILQRFNPSRSQTILATASPETNKQWMRNQTYPEPSIGRLHRRNHVHRCWLSARLSWARCLTDLNRHKCPREKDRPIASDRLSLDFHAETNLHPDYPHPVHLMRSYSQRA